MSNYLQQVLEELDEKTPALQQLRRNYDTAVQNCDQLTTQLSTTVEVGVGECVFALTIDDRDTKCRLLIHYSIKS